jgi:plastocyanin
MILTRREFTAGALGVLATPALATSAIAGGQMHEVEIRNFAFHPDQLEVRHGDQICFTNSDLTPHTATANDGSWDSGTLEGGDRLVLEITSEWTGGYFCAYHPQMKAALVIR